MNIAFHFDTKEFGTWYGKPIEEMFFRALLDARPDDIHIKIRRGDLLAWEYLGKAEAREKVLEGLLGYTLRWRELDTDEFRPALFSTRIYVLVAEGLTPAPRDQIHLQLKRDHRYLGALEVHPANPVHWVLYLRLPPAYRFFNGGLRIFYRAFEEAEGAYPVVIPDYLKKLPFRSLEREDLGVRHTLFDAYDSLAHAERAAAVADYLSEHLARLANDVLLRLSDVSPQLVDTLFGMLKAFESVETEEEVAHVGLSCRRFLEGLADVLYPPRDETVQGRKLTRESYINRLWAYCEEKLHGDQKKLFQIQLEDIGRRIDKIYALANKALHAEVSPAEMGRFIVALFVVAYDLLSLSAPPLHLPLDPHAKEIERTAKELSKRTRSDENGTAD